MTSAALTSGLSPCDFLPDRLVLNVSSIGWRFKQALERHPFQGRVHSVFPQAFNLELPDGQVFGIVAGGTRHCLVASVEGRVAWRRLQSGMAVKYGGGVLEVPEAGIYIEVGRAGIWKGTGSQVALGSASEMLQAAIAAASVGYRFGSRTGLGGLLGYISGEPGKITSQPGWPRWLDRARFFLTELLSSLASREPAAAEVAARELVGLGPGLTPSGDDLLAGVVGTWWWWQRAGRWRSPLLQRCLEGVARAAREKTNVFGYQEVSWAARGELPEVALKVVMNVIRGRRTDLRSEVLALTGLGSSSGTDMLTGICFAIMGILNVETGTGAQRRLHSVV